VTGYSLDRNDLEEVLKLVNFCMKQMTIGHIDTRDLLMEMLQIFRSYDAEFFPPNQNLTGIELNNTSGIKESNDDLKKYIDYYWQYDPLYPTQSKPEPTNRVFKTDDIISYSQLKELPYYREYLRHINWFSELIIRLCTNNGFWGSISLTRSPNQPYFNSKDVQKAEFLLPYLINTFEATMFFSRINGERRALEQWLESRPEGIILLDAEVRPVFFNEKARQICDQLRGPETIHRKNPDIELPEFIVEDCRRIIKFHDGNSCFSNNRIVNMKNMAKYYIKYSLIYQPSDDFTLPHFIIHINPLSKNDNEEIVLPRDYSLSEREETIAHYTGLGLTNKEIGKKLDISPFTVQSHLRNIFEKMGIKRRAQLANLTK
jgi:DNA-binding CsgD family transcriptional regulator/PAS domain-containing protein